MFRDFFTALPARFLPAELAEIYGDLNGKLFDHELAKPEGLLSRKAIPDSYDRMAFAFVGWLGLVPDNLKAELEYAMNLAEFIDLHLGIQSGDVIDDGKAANMEQALRADEPNYPEIAKLMSVDQVKAATNWA